MKNVHSIFFIKNILAEDISVYQLIFNNDIISDYEEIPLTTKAVKYYQETAVVAWFEYWTTIRGIWQQNVLQETIMSITRNMSIWRDIDKAVKYYQETAVVAFFKHWAYMLDICR